jgi:hypothetical protein
LTSSNITERQRKHGQPTEGRQERQIMKKTIALGALVLAAAAGSASAGVQTSSFSYGPNSVPYSGSGTLAKFDDNGGLYVLKNIVFTYNVTLSANVSVTALSGPQSVDVGVVGNANATDGLFSLPISLSGSWTSPVLNSGDTHNFGVLTVSDFASYTVPAALWPLYTGAGTISINYSGTGLFGVQGGGNATIDVTNFGGSGSVTVQYFYNIIPTPGAMALLGMGGLLAGRRRR